MIRDQPGTIQAPEPPAIGPTVAMWSGFENMNATVHRRPAGGWVACLWDGDVPPEDRHAPADPGGFVGCRVYSGRPEATAYARRTICPRCYGRGEVRGLSEEGEPTRLPCPRCRPSCCDGTDQINGAPCPCCASSSNAGA